MKTKIKTLQEVELKTLVVDAGVRYWEDAEVNGVEDSDGNLIPCRVNDRWCPIIDIDTGIITNWAQGVRAEIHYKICDDGIYRVEDDKGNTVLRIDGYVPTILYPKEDGCGDYIIMDIDEAGKIADWNPDFADFLEE